MQNLDEVTHNDVKLFTRAKCWSLKPFYCLVDVTQKSLGIMYNGHKKYLEDLVRSILGPSYQGVNIQHVQQQQNFCDCGVFAIAFATCLVYAKFPLCVRFNIPMMRPHLLKCLKNRSMELFPTV
jgi:hypothetical protein